MAAVSAQNQPEEPALPTVVPWLQHQKRNGELKVKNKEQFEKKGNMSLSWRHIKYV
jgi:hypothetical protein